MSFFLDEDKKEIENTRLNSGFCIIVDIKEFLKNKNINKNNFSYIQCRKNIKGWNNPQIFNLITNEELFSDTIETIIPSEDGDVNIELLKKFVKINGQEIIDENLNKKGINNE